MGVHWKILCFLMLLLHKSSQQEVFNDKNTLNLPANDKIGWMETLDDDKLISTLTIPGTHDALALYGGPFAKCQAWSLEDQLKAGIRYFDLRTMKNTGVPGKILCILMLILHRSSQQVFNDEKTLILPKNYQIGWMANLNDEKLVTELTIPGTHDSLALHGGPAAECQAWSLEDQLNAGIRYFDLRVSGDNLKVITVDCVIAAIHSDEILS
ncbi:PLC-like phosphodiesterases superfamily protein [Pimephales promelas]|nr:PLC-like phosphodiesterases superfamily protein [Pimephales promelas]